MPRVVPAWVSYHTWNRRSERTMTFAGYHAAGGVQGAIAKTADGVYAELPPEQQAIARGIFLRLTTLGEGVQDTRRRAPLPELLGSGDQTVQVQAVLKRLEDERLVTAERSTTAAARRIWPPTRRTAAWLRPAPWRWLRTTAGLRADAARLWTAARVRTAHASAPRHVA